MKIKEGDLVMLRIETRYGFSNSWWRVMFLDNDSTFIGKLERKHWRELPDCKIGDCNRHEAESVKRIFKEGEQFCYSDKITICECSGLCREK